MKFLKAIFGRFTVTAFLICIQVALLFAMFVYFSTEFLIYYFVSAALSFVALLFVLGRDMDAEYKVPWVFVIVLFQLLGVIIYGLFGRVTLSRRQRKRLLDVRALLRRNRNCTDGMDPVALGQSEFLYNTSGCAAFRDTDVTYFPSGEAMYERMLSDLRAAEKFIFLEYFIIARGVMWDGILEILREKARAGVEVRVLYDDIGSIKLLPARYAKSISEPNLTVRRFNKFNPVVSVLHNFRDHRKIAVIDGNVAYTGGVNLSDEYINATHPHGMWKDSAVRLEGSAVDTMTELFLSAWNINEKTDETFSQYLCAEPVAAEGWVQPFGDNTKPLDSARIGEQMYLNLIESAVSTLHLTTPYLIVGRAFLHAIARAAARGVDVALIVPHIPDKKPVFWLTRHNYNKLVRAGVRVYEYTPGFIHAKSCVTDGRYAFCGTINLDYRSFVHHMENGVWMVDTPAVADMEADFAATVAVSELIDESNMRRPGFFKRLILTLLGIFAPLF